MMLELMLMAMIYLKVITNDYEDITKGYEVINNGYNEREVIMNEKL